MSATAVTEQTPPRPLASDLCWLLNRAGQLLADESARALDASGISLRQHSVLAMAMAGEHTQTDLARSVGLDKTTMMVTLDELERAGLAQRRPLATDRRARVIAVTAAGERAVAQADAVLARVRENVLGLLAPAERPSFIDALGRLACAANIGSACAGSVPPAI